VLRTAFLMAEELFQQTNPGTAADLGIGPTFDELLDVSQRYLDSRVVLMQGDFVLRYLVTHEAVHLAIPDHSAKFWLTVQSLCHETERAKQWLCRHQAQLQVDLASVLEGDTRSRTPNTSHFGKAEPTRKRRK
jgi:hypothetical protein